MAMVRQRWKRGWALGAASLLLSGCYVGGFEPAEGGTAGEAGEEAGDGDGDVDSCEVPVVSPRPLHRLTPLQYQRTVEDAFGLPDFEPTYESLVDGELDLLSVRQLRDDTETILARQGEWAQPVFPCDLDGVPDPVCADDFISEFGSRLFRRPLSAEEFDWLRSVYEHATGAMAFRDAMEVVLSTMLQSPSFLYLIETGVEDPSLPLGTRRLTGFELASRLSYGLWDTAPDDELLAAAIAGDLDDPDGIEAQVDRLLADPRAQDVVGSFVSHWLELDGGQVHFGLDDTTKDAGLFPEFDDGMRVAMRTELQAFAYEQMIVEDSFEGLFTDTSAYVNSQMAELYGVDGPADPETWAWVELDPQQRGGLFSRAGFLSVYASQRAQSPIRRGAFVIERALCGELAPPPPDVDDSPIEGGEVDGQLLTVREDVSLRTSGMVCMGCHAVINPIGFAFEHYDAIGRWQTDEVVSGLPVDSSGELTFGDNPGEVNGPVEMLERLSDSREARSCYAREWLGRTTGLYANQLSPCDEERILTQFEETGSTHALIKSIASSDAFRFINTGDQ